MFLPQKQDLEEKNLMPADIWREDLLGLFYQLFCINAYNNLLIHERVALFSGDLFDQYRLFSCLVIYWIILNSNLMKNLIRELFRKSTSSLFRRYTCLYYIIFTCFHNISVWKDICCTFFYWYFPLVGILFLDFVTSLNTVKKMLLILSPKKKQNKTKYTKKKMKKMDKIF